MVEERNLLLAVAWKGSVLFAVMGSVLQEAFRHTLGKSTRSVRMIFPNLS
ncbi:MAG: hypothetical protein M2R45_05012 [Verrucomicrobia subdivision 3 bacterium]|nr:hypothetical protein [Limisphaerales bacterium]